MGDRRRSMKREDPGTPLCVALRTHSHPNSMTACRHEKRKMQNPRAGCQMPTRLPTRRWTSVGCRHRWQEKCDYGVGLDHWSPMAKRIESTRSTWLVEHVSDAAQNARRSIVGAPQFNEQHTEKGRDAAGGRIDKAGSQHQSDERCFGPRGAQRRLAVPGPGNPKPKPLWKYE